MKIRDTNWLFLLMSFVVFIGLNPVISSATSTLGSVIDIKGDTRADSLWFTQVSGCDTDSVTVDLMIDNEDTAVSVFTIYLNYDVTMLNYVSCSVGTLDPGWTMFDCNEASPGEVRIIAFIGTGGIAAGSYGDIVNLVFEVDCPTCSNGDFTDLTFAAVYDDVAGFDLTDGRFTYDCPTATPTDIPTSTPTTVPTSTPTTLPTDTPTDVPTSTPTTLPTDTPTDVPTSTPTTVPTETPTPNPTETPTGIPTNTPTDIPTSTTVPTDTPTTLPTDTPTDVPTSTPTPLPTNTPTDIPTSTPTTVPTETPTPNPTETPTFVPTNTPSVTPTPNDLIWVNNYSACTNDTIDVEVWIENNDTPLDSIAFHLIYDAVVMTYSSCTAGALDPGWLSFACNEVISGDVTVGGFASPGFIPVGSHGVLAILTFDVDCTSCVNGQANDLTITMLDDDLEFFIPTHGEFTYYCQPTATPTIVPTEIPTDTPAMPTGTPGPIPSTGPAGVGFLLFCLSVLIGISGFRSKKQR